MIRPEILTDLRLLSSSIDEDIFLKIVFCGQQDLGQLLKRSSLADMANRINVQFILKSMARPGTSAYIDHRVVKAGGSDKLFDQEAKDLIHDYTGGVPRQVNNVATACLINAASRNIKMVTEPLVNETMAQFHLP